MQWRLYNDVSARYPSTNECRNAKQCVMRKATKHRQIKPTTKEGKDDSAVTWRLASKSEEGREQDRNLSLQKKWSDVLPIPLVLMSRRCSFSRHRNGRF